MTMIDVLQAVSAFRISGRQSSTRCTSEQNTVLKVLSASGSFSAKSIRNLIVSLAMYSLCLSQAPNLWADEGLDDYNVAVNLYKRSRWKSAAEEFRKFIKTYSNHEKAPIARLYLGLTLVELSDFKTAREELRKFADENRQNSNLAQARYRIGECSYLLDDLENARAELESFVQTYPDDAMCDHALPYAGDTLLRLKEPAAALKYFDRAIEKFPQGKLIDDAKFGRARALELLKRPEEAIQQYQVLAKQKDGIRGADAQFYLGAIYFEQKQFPEAVETYARLIKENPQSSLVPAAQLNAGYAYFHSGKFEDAMRQFEVAGKDKSQAITAKYWLGRSLKSIGDYSKAIETLREPGMNAEEHPLAQSILYEQALCERYLQHPKEARELFEKVLTKYSMGDLADDSLHALIEMSIDSGDFNEADLLLARFQKDFPQSGLRLHVVMLNGRLDLARASQITREKPSGTESKVLYESAAQRFEQVMKESALPKTKGQARYYLALTKQMQGDQTQSLELISPLVDQVIAEGGKIDLADALILQADNYYGLQKYDSAAQAVAKYLDIAPKGRQVVRGLSIQALIAQSKNDSTARDAALGRLSKEFANHPLTTSTFQQLAEIAESKDDWVTSGQIYNDLSQTEKDPEKRAFALRGVAVSQYRREKFAEAADTFARIIDGYPNLNLVPECTYFRADSLKRTGETQKSLALFKSLFETFDAKQPPLSDSNSVPLSEYQYKAGLQVARMLNVAKKIDESDAIYELVFTKFPRPSDLDKRLKEWATLNYENGRFDRGDEIWKRLVAETPKSPLVPEAKLSLAESDLVAGQLDVAQQSFNELSETEECPDIVKERCLYQLIVIAVEQQQWLEVKTRSERLISTFPSSKHRFYAAYAKIESYLSNPNLSGQELASSKKLAENLLRSEKEFRTETAEDPPKETQWFDRVWVLLAELNFREKKYSEVSEIVADLEKQRPDSEYLYQAIEVLGRSFKQQAPPKFDEARTAFERVVKDKFAARNETAAKAQFMIGETWFLQRKWKQAFTAYERVYANYQFPEWQSRALLMSAKCDEEQNDWKAAAETLKLLLKEFPQSSVVDEAKTRLETSIKKQNP